MAWLKKVTLFILSAVLITFTSCERARNKAEIEKSGIISKEELIVRFFNKIQNWRTESVEAIDSLGYQISQLDSSLNFLPYLNDYDNGAFIFTSNNKGAFDIFENSSFLNKSIVSEQNNYKVWRKKLNNLQILDLSIEPHPTLDWIFVIRLRSQE
ncbi:MAG TPA: hypothetical protein VKY37_05520 [Brumimicrobium sp.]|nr:hypothetical protein [Brumimicrobium sp.]